jgi:hypothetical protein
LSARRFAPPQHAPALRLSLVGNASASPRFQPVVSECDGKLGSHDFRSLKAAGLNPQRGLADSEPRRGEALPTSQGVSLSVLTSRR